jgi:hypothetical protein
LGKSASPFGYPVIGDRIILTAKQYYSFRKRYINPQTVYLRVFLLPSAIQTIETAVQPVFFPGLWQVLEQAPYPFIISLVSASAIDVHKAGLPFPFFHFRRKAGRLISGFAGGTPPDPLGPLRGFWVCAAALLGSFYIPLLRSRTTLFASFSGKRRILLLLFHPLSLLSKPTPFSVR